MRRARVLLSFRSLGVAGTFVAALVGCPGPPEGSVSVVTGDETDVFSREPAPVTLLTEKVLIDGTRSEIRRTALQPPPDNVDLGELPRMEAGSLAVTGLDSTGNALVRGETLLVQWGALEHSTLEVFVQRTGELARMPRGPAAIDATQATMLVGRYVLATNDTSIVIYDLLGLRTFAGPPALPRPARSIATIGTTALVIDEAGATTLDLSTGNSFPLDAPTGGSFAEIAGGRRVPATDGAQYIVGGTRTAGGATPRILVVDAGGKATFAALTTPREGACAAWVDGRGLVVVGGAADGAGAEVLAPGAATATSLPFPAEPVRGCGAATLDTAHVAIAGGAGATGDTGTGVPVRVLDLACTTECALASWPDPIALGRAEVVALAPDAAFVLGDDASGATHAFRASAARGIREIALRIPRRGARLVRTPTNAIGIIGGGFGIEQYLE